MWLEMTRDTKHGGPGWEFATCLWSPSHKNPSGHWPFWDSLLLAKKDDVVVHLRGKGRSAFFVGYSIVDGDGYKTRDRPPESGKYAYAATFYRVPLKDFIEFDQAFSLQEVFRKNEEALTTLLKLNELKTKKQREHLFYVLQAGRLQCLNGAYLSDFGETLAEIVFGRAFGNSSNERTVEVRTRTGEQLSRMKARIGQAAFSEQVRSNYGHRCCFPGCTVDEDRLLVGSHIARWSDCQHLRGETANGLSLCPIHDRCFELGLFTITQDSVVAVNRAQVATNRWSMDNLLSADGLPIRPSVISPSRDALIRHWERIRFTPGFRE